MGLALQFIYKSRLKFIDKSNVERFSQSRLQFIYNRLSLTTKLDAIIHLGHLFSLLYAIYPIVTMINCATPPLTSWVVERWMPFFGFDKYLFFFVCYMTYHCYAQQIILSLFSLFGQYAYPSQVMSSRPPSLDFSINDPALG